ncbi:CRISPR-associated endonuclease Cas1 [Clostridium aceticum]|uniref:CRISPR-associated endonuclease Cas1 n=1 Tax=Clostridium aceticum TaxID=84022 RepID=A0A0D8IE22_9CLOT|nr:type I-B CRISPR-associated endonuclease Cas1b [Clostridium aceticum]AKL94557.1 CRISPR-associated endonuclease Cas1 [Clostridium aceticum]KJF28242.1 CRISPR-associated protein Cas1 [Clostridium aceticum]
MKKKRYIFSDGEFRRKDNTIYFETEEGKTYIPIEDLNDIYIFGEVTFNKKFIDFISQKEVCLHFFNYHGYYSGTYYPREHLNSGYMILNQARFYLEEDKRLFLAKGFVDGSHKNILKVLVYYKNRGKDLGGIIESIENLGTKIKDMNNVAKLMAIEGNIREAYYEAFDIILENEDFVFEGRSRRPPKNELNALISFGNSLLYILVLSEIYKTHLDPRIGYLHTTNFRRFTLNLDIAEIFKPIIIDRIMFTLIGKKMLTKKDFEKDMGGILLKEKGRKIFVQSFNERLASTIAHRELGRNVSYQRLVRMEAYKLQKHFMEEEEYTPYISRW